MVLIRMIMNITMSKTNMHGHTIYKGYTMRTTRIDLMSSTNHMDMNSGGTRSRSVAMYMTIDMTIRATMHMTMITAMTMYMLATMTVYMDLAIATNMSMNTNMILTISMNMSSSTYDEHIHILVLIPIV